MGRWLHGTVRVRVPFDNVDFQAMEAARRSGAYWLRCRAIVRGSPCAISIMSGSSACIGTMFRRDAEYPRPDHVLVHISDTHLLGGDARLYDRVDSAARLRKLLTALEGTGRRPAALVFTGDLADQGE